MKLTSSPTLLLILSFLTSCEPAVQSSHPATEKQNSSADQPPADLNDATTDMRPAKDTITAFLRKALGKRKLLPTHDLLVVDSFDAQNGCYAFLQHSGSLEQSAKRWLYYPQTKTLVDVANEGELSLSDDGLTEEDRSKMANIELERPTL